MKIKDYDDVLDLELDSMDKFVLQCLAFYQVCNFPPFDPFSVELVLCFRSQNLVLCDKFQSHLRICRNNCFLSMLLNKLGKKMPQAQNLVSVFFIYNQDATDSQLIMNCDPVELQY